MRYVKRAECYDLKTTNKFDMKMSQLQRTNQPTAPLGRGKTHTRTNTSTKYQKCNTFGERSGSVVECLTRDRRAASSSLTGVTALCL